jgi:hypothetical protein
VFVLGLKTDVSPLPLSADIIGNLFHLARKHNLGVAEQHAFVAWAGQNTVLVRETFKRFQLGRQFAELEPLLTAWRAETSQS